MVVSPAAAQSWEHQDPRTSGLRAWCSWSSILTVWVGRSRGRHDQLLRPAGRAVRFPDTLPLRQRDRSGSAGTTLTTPDFSGATRGVETCVTDAGSWSPHLRHPGLETRHSPRKQRESLRAQRLVCVSRSGLSTTFPGPGAAMNRRSESQSFGCSCHCPRRRAGGSGSSMPSPGSRAGCGGGLDRADRAVVWRGSPRGGAWRKSRECFELRASEERRRRSDPESRELRELTMLVMHPYGLGGPLV